MRQGLTRRILQSPVCAEALALWRRGRRLGDSAVEYGRALRMGMYFGLPDIILFYGYSLGDDLLCTTVLRELRNRSRGPLWMISSYPDLFTATGDAAKVLLPSQFVKPRPPAEHRHLVLHNRFSKLWSREFRVLENDQFDIVEDRITAPKRHVIAELCARGGVSGKVTLRPHLDLIESEKAEAGWARGKVVIQSSGLAAQRPMRNKEWYPDRFQTVVNALHREFDFIQIGASIDPPLQNVTDLRGSTTIRQSAAILHQSRLYIGNEGFLMHLARAVECPSVVVYGGRVKPWQIGYVCNANVYSSPPCSPCWRSNKCDFDRRCMHEVTPHDVIEALRTMLGRPRGPLEEEIAEI
jgi:hypothetical protein